MKKRIKTRRLTNIYQSDDDDVGDGYNLLSPLSLSLSLSLGPSPSSQYIYQQSHVLRFFSTVLGLLLLLATAKSVFLNHYCNYEGLVPGTDWAFNIITDFMGCSMNLTVAGQRPSVQNSIIVLFPDIFMNFWLLSYRNGNRYVI